jgi:cytoskeletal protein CcmA (bactofilin family)
MWKSRKPEEEREKFGNQKEKLPVIPVEEKQIVETRFERNPTLANERIINVGKSVSIKGELSGGEDLIIEGRVEGQIKLRNHNLEIGPHGAIKGEIRAKNLTVNGRVDGNISTEQLVEIKASGSVVGDIESSRISIADGAYFKGNANLRRNAGTRAGLHSSEPETVEVNTEQEALAELQAT